MLSKQSIRNNVKIYINGKKESKDKVLELSKEWDEKEEKFFRKMLKQGGGFKLKGVKFNIIAPPLMVNNKGEKDKGIIQVPGIGDRF